MFDEILELLIDDFFSEYIFAIYSIINYSLFNIVSRRVLISRLYKVICV